MEHKIVTHIDCPKEWESKNDWDSHRELLWLIINKFPHNTFYEFGVGMGSTPLLREWYCEINNLGKEYYSFENNKVWFLKLGEEYSKNNVRDNSYIYKNHCITYTEDYLFWSLFDKSIAFIDSAPGEQRKILIEKHANIANVIIVHDTEPGAEYVYGMGEILSTFKYRIDYQPEGKPHTTAVSNFINIEEWVK